MPLFADVSPPSDWKGILAVLLVVLLMAVLTSGQHPCQKESIMLLKDIIQHLGNSSDAELYTPENFTVRIFYRCYILEACYASNLDCFLLELNVIILEEEDHADTLSRVLSRLGKLQPRKNCTDPHAQCQPCECNTEQPVPFFLSKLRQMLQWSCKKQILPCAAKQKRTC